ncbi:glycosyltransferase family 4 protein [Actinomadura rubrisoli]|uniref:Glycosyltransferase family 4 protein n=1 Tax=Actinomadura rubrisoli TaxID=2530368 RepID=A0A4R5BCE9_9ACTN|nr:glycosyltransferase family 4 protein [Actinomadura rubrisoli]TDD82376.1 glycosyltransferase family 4 protein [Actinomadura rubrisoli]
MRITFMLLDAFTIDGTVRSTFTLAGELARRHDVEIISVLREADEPALALSGRVRLRSLVDLRTEGRSRWPVGTRAARLKDAPSTLVHPQERCYDHFSAWTDDRITRALRRLRSDVLVTTRAGLNLAAAQLAPRRTVTIGQEHLQLGMHRPGILSEIEHWYPRLDAVTTLTAADREDYRRLLPDGSCPVYAIGNGLPDRLFPLSRQENRVIVAAGRLVWLKGYDLLIDAFVEVAEKHPEWRLRIYGKGPRLDALRERVTRLGLFNNVLLMDATGDMEGEMAKASILALPSRSEGFGMTIVEAFACGLPVVAFDCRRGPREIITDGHDGLLVPPEDTAALAEALIRLIDDEELRRRMAGNARTTARAHRVGEVATHWERMLTELRSAR